MAKWGSFYTEGRRFEYGDSFVMVDQAYVQYHHPSADAPERLPIVFIHGGGLSGAVWETTPDGRAGWGPLTVDAGWTVYIVDTVDVGRAGRAPDALRDGPVEWKTARQMWERYRIGAAADWPSETPFVDGQFPANDFDTLVRAHVTRRRSTDLVEAAGIVAAIRQIGPCHVIAHSHGAAMMAAVITEVESLVRRTVLVEPLPFSPNPSLVASNTLLVWGDHTDGHAIWSHVIPTYRACDATQLCLPDEGIRGNSHLPMCDRNSGTVLRLILEWLDA